MNLYLIGSDSYIAKNFYNKSKYKSSCKCIHNNPNNKNNFSFDLLNPKKFNFNIIEKDSMIAFFAANSSPDYCENHFQSAYGVNVTGTSYFIRKFLEKNAKVLFFSSDAIFNGGDKIFYEDSTGCPVSKYGEMKLSIEKEFKKNKNVKIFRLSYVYSKKDKFSSYLHNCIEKKCEAEIYPIYRNVVYLDDVITGIDNLIEGWDSWDNQIFNICGKDLISRANIAEYFKEIVSDINLKIVEPEESFFKARPRVIEMKSNFFSSLLKKEPTQIKDAMLEEYKK